MLIIIRNTVNIRHKLPTFNSAVLLSSEVSHHEWVWDKIEYNYKTRIRFKWRQQPFRIKLWPRIAPSLNFSFNLLWWMYVIINRNNLNYSISDACQTKGKIAGSNLDGIPMSGPMCHHVVYRSHNPTNNSLYNYWWFDGYWLPCVLNYHRLHYPVWQYYSKVSLIVLASIPIHANVSCQ